MSLANEISYTPNHSIGLFFNAYLLEDDNNNHSAALATTHDQPRRPQYVRIRLMVRDQIPHDDGFDPNDISLPSNYPLQFFDSAQCAGLLFESILGTYLAYAGTNGIEHLHWGYDGQGYNDRLRWLGDVVDRLSQTAVSIVHGALAATGDNNAAEALTIVVEVFRRTLVQTEEHGHLDLPAPADDDNRRVIDSDAAAELFETVRYDGDGGVEDLECVICLKEVLSGTHVARLPCAHRFHENCIVPWLRRSRTCPLCRFSVGQKRPRSTLS